MEQNIVQILSSLNLLWKCFFSTAGAVILYAFIAVIWYGRLSSRVTKNEALFEEFCRTSKEKDLEMKKSIDNVSSIVRRIERVVDILEERAEK